MAIKATTAEHEKFFMEVTTLLKDYEHLPAIDLLALVSNITGRLCAMQDQRRYSPQAVLTIVSENLEAGNQQMVAILLNTEGTA